MDECMLMGKMAPLVFIIGVQLLQVYLFFLILVAMLNLAIIR